MGTNKRHWSSQRELGKRRGSIDQRSHTCRINSTIIFSQIWIAPWLLILQCGRELVSFSNLSNRNWFIITCSSTLWSLPWPPEIWGNNFHFCRKIFYKYLTHNSNAVLSHQLSFEDNFEKVGHWSGNWGHLEKWSQ